MRTVAYSDVLGEASELFSAAAPDVRDAGTLNRFIRRRVREFWRKTWWPEWTVTEKRYFRAWWESGKAYVAGDEVYDVLSNAYYQALRASTGQAPTSGAAGVTVNLAYWAVAVCSPSGSDWSSTAVYAVGTVVRYGVDGRFYQAHTTNTAQVPTNTAYWGVLNGFVRSIDRAQVLAGGVAATVIGEVRRVYTQDVGLRGLAPTEEFQETGTGFVVWGEAPVVWVRFRLPVPDYSGAVWEKAKSYQVGEQVYFVNLAGDGDYYAAVAVALDGESPTVAPDKWAVIGFPERLASAVAQAAYADQLRVDGQNEKAGAELGEAMRILGTELMVVERQEGQVGDLAVTGR